MKEKNQKKTGDIKNEEKIGKRVMMSMKRKLRNRNKIDQEEEILKKDKHTREK